MGLPALDVFVAAGLAAALYTVRETLLLAVFAWLVFVVEPWLTGNHQAVSAGCVVMKSLTTSSYVRRCIAVNLVAQA